MVTNTHTKIESFDDEYLAMAKAGMKVNEIVLERLVDLGNYENVRIGGKFSVDPLMHPDSNMIVVVNRVKELIEEYKEAHFDTRTSPSMKLHRAQEKLETFKRILQEKATPKIALAQGGLEELNNLIRDYEDLVLEDINYQLQTIYSLKKDFLDGLISDTSISTEDLNVVHNLFNSNDEFSFGKLYSKVYGLGGPETSLNQNTTQ